MDVTVPRIGRLFFNMNIGSAQVAQIVAPASNSGGIIIRTCQVLANPSSANNGVNLYADTSAPADARDTTRRIVLDASTYANANTYAITHLPFPLFIDPGFGLWIASVPSGAGGSCLMTYDLLGLAMN